MFSATSAQTGMICIILHFKKLQPYFFNNSVKNLLILMIFGIPHHVVYQKSLESVDSSS